MTNAAYELDIITLNIPGELLEDLEKVADIIKNSRRSVILRALKTYMNAEGKDLRDIGKAREEIEAGKALDSFKVFTEIDYIIRRHLA